MLLHRRLLQNPSYYDLGATDPESVSAFLSDMVERTLATLQVRPVWVLGVSLLEIYCVHQLACQLHMCMQV